MLDYSFSIDRNHVRTVAQQLVKFKNLNYDALVKALKVFFRRPGERRNPVFAQVTAFYETINLSSLKAPQTREFHNALQQWRFVF
jgi:hypothetical protein